MKKILLTIIGLALASSAWSAQTAVTQINGTQASIGALKTQVNTKLETVESNRQDHETRVAAVEDGKADKTSFASQSAFTSAWGWNPGDNLGSATAANISSLFSGSGDCLKSDGTKGDCGTNSGSMTWPASDSTYYGVRNGAWVNLSGIFAAPLGSDDNYVTDAEKIKLGNLSGTNTGDQDLSGYALTSSVLSKTNTTSFTPTTDWHPATKKYVDDLITAGGANVAVENTWTAIQNFNAGLTATGIELTLGDLTDIKLGTDPWVDDTKTSGHLNYLWSSKKVFDQLALKSDTTHNHTGLYQAASANLTAAAGISGNSKYYGTNSGGTVGVYDLPAGGGFTFDAFPTYEDSPHSSKIAFDGATGTLAIFDDASAKWMLSAAGAFTDILDPAPVTYGLTVDFVGVTGADKITIGTDYSTDTTITGLSGSTAFTVVPDTGRTGDCTGTGISGTTPNKYADMSANRSMTCTFSDGGYTSKPPLGTSIRSSGADVDGLVAAWAFNEATGVPYSSNAVAATVNYSTPAWTDGQYVITGGAVTLNTTPPSGAMSVVLMGDFTTEGKIQVHLKSGSLYPHIRMNVSDTTCSLILSSEGTNSRTWNVPSGSQSNKDNVWTFTLPGNAQADIETAKLYLNGTEMTVHATYSTTAQDTRTSITLGAPGVQFTTASFNALQIYNKVITPKTNAWDIYQ